MILDQAVWNDIVAVLDAGTLVPPGEWCPTNDLIFHPPAERGGAWRDEIREAVADGRLESQRPPTWDKRHIGFVRRLARGLGNG